MVEESASHLDPSRAESFVQRRLERWRGGFGRWRCLGRALPPFEEIIDGYDVVRRRGLDDGLSDVGRAHRMLHQLTCFAAEWDTVGGEGGYCSPSRFL